MRIITLANLTLGGVIHGASVGTVTAHLAVTADNQTVFELAAACTSPANSLLTINGQSQRYPQDYTVDGVVLTYSNRHYQLKIGDEVDFYYY